MRHILLLVPLVLFKLSSAAQKSSDLKWVQYHLTNGLTVILQSDANQPNLVVEAWINSGTSSDPSGKFGLAHFAEHATPYGFQNDTSKLNLFRQLRVNSNAQTRKDYVRYYTEIKPDGLDLALQYTAERLRIDTSVLVDSFVEKHRINVLNEISRQESNAFFNATAASSRDAALFGTAHPYGHGVYGSVESNSSLSSLDLKHWFNHYFKAGNMALIVVGNFKVAQAKKLIATYFETIPKGKKSRPHIAFEPMQPLGRIVPVPVQENYAFLFWPGTSLQSTQSAAMLLLAFLMENRLAQLDTMLVKDGECLSSTQFYQHSGSFGVSATFKKIKDSSVIVNRLKMVVESFTKDAVSEMELQRVKKNMRLALQTKLAKLGFTDSRSEMLGEGYVLTGDAGRYLKLYKQALTLVPKDIKAVAKYVLTREPHLQICWSTAHE